MDRRRRWVFLWHDVRGFARRVYEGAGEANVPFLASALTFDALLAAVPFGLVVLGVLGYVLHARAAALRLDLAAYLALVLPSYGHATNPFAPVISLAEGIVSSRGRLSLIGLPLFVWFATRLFTSLRSALDEIFDVRETRSWLQGKLADVRLVGLTGLLFGASLAVGDVVVARAVRIGIVEFVATQAAAFAFLIALFVVMFRYAPARRLAWDTALVAAVVCAVALDLAKELLGLYFRGVMRPEALVSDATLGALILLVAWLYYMTFVFLIGGQIAQVYELRRRQAMQRAVLH